MGRVLIGALAVLVIAIIAGRVVTTRYDSERAVDQQKISDLQQENGKLSDENAQLTADLAKVQREQERLKAANDQLSRALESARLTGKIPPLPEGALPYPPK